MYKRKTKDLYILMANYGYGDGWEYVTAEESQTEIKKRLKEYRENVSEYQYKIVKTRIKITDEREKGNEKNN